MSEVGDYILKKHKRTEFLSVGERHQKKLEIQRIWRAKNREKVNAYGRKQMKERRKNFPEQIKEYKQKQYLIHRDYYIEKSRQWRLNNRERYNAKLRECYQKRKVQRNKSRCVGCESILKEHEKLVCAWCVSTYPHRYARM